MSERYYTRNSRVLWRLWNIVTIVIVCVFGSTTCHAPTRPAVSTTPFEDTVVLFLTKGDLWQTDLEGTNPERLTNDQLYGSKESAWRAVEYQRPQVSPDGNWLALPTEAAIRLLALQGQESISISLPDDNIGPPQVDWSPNGKRLAYVADDTLSIYDLAQDSSEILFTESQLWGMAWSPDGHYITTVSLDEQTCCQGNVWLIHAGEGSAQKVGQVFPPPEAAMKHAIWWAPDRSRLLIGGPSVDFSSIYHVADGISREIEVSTVGWSPDGRYVITTDFNLVDPITGELYISLEPTNSSCQQKKRGAWSWAWSPSGQYWAGIASCQSTFGEVGTESLVYVTDIRTGEVVWKRVVRMDLTVVEWSLDEEHLIVDMLNQVADVSPIWRLPVDESSEMKEIVEEGFLVDVILP